MAFDILAHLIELVFGPIFLLLHIPELGVALGDVVQILELVAAGDVAGVGRRLVEGDFAVTTRTFASFLGTVMWVMLVGGLFGEFAGLGELGELLELFG